MKFDGSSMPLDRWVEVFSRIYVSQNHERSVLQILCRVYEVAESLQKAAIKRKDYDECKSIWLPKVFAWFCALVRSIDVSNLEVLVWSKFPGLCPFCRLVPCSCQPGKKANMDLKFLREAAEQNSTRRPMSLSQWQALFEEIYRQRSRGLVPKPVGPDNTNGKSLLHGSILKLYEELTELSEAIRLRPFYPDNVKNEIADVFASICGLANCLPVSFGLEEKLDLGVEVWRKYPDVCDTCGNTVCNCRLSAVEERLSKQGVKDFERKDSLTGLFNEDQCNIDRRRLFGMPEDDIVAEMYFDFDNFKFFNEQTARKHDQGDAILRTVGQSALSICEKMDGCTPYRLHGDEFTLLIHTSSIDKAKGYATTFFKAISGLQIGDLEDENKQYSITISAGLAFRSREMRDPDELRLTADKTQYEAKSSGKGKLVIGRQD